MSKHKPDTERYRTPLGIVTSLGPRHRRPKDGAMEWYQQGHVWRQGCLAWVRRWGWDGEWVLTGEQTERIRQPPQRILPELTVEERQAWADHVKFYDGESETDAARCLPGWGDTSIFHPPRVPGSRERMWDDRSREFNYNRPVKRAIAIVRMARRHAKGGSDADHNLSDT